MAPKISGKSAGLRLSSAMYFKGTLGSAISSANPHFAEVNLSTGVAVPPLRAVSGTYCVYAEDKAELGCLHHQRPIVQNHSMANSSLWGFPFDRSSRLKEAAKSYRSFDKSTQDQGGRLFGHRLDDQSSRPTTPSNTCHLVAYARVLSAERLLNRIRCERFDLCKWGTGHQVEEGVLYGCGSIDMPGPARQRGQSVVQVQSIGLRAYSGT